MALESLNLFVKNVVPEDSISPSGALLIGSGKSTAFSKVTDAGKNFLSFYLENAATSGDNRGMYLRLKLSGGGGGEAARIFTNVQDTTAGTAHGAHVSLSFGSTGKITGLGAAGRHTLHIPNDGTQSGTLTAHQVEIWSDGSDSDTAGATEVSFLRFSNAGHADGIADVEDDAFLFSLQGFADAEGNLFRAVAPTTLAASFRVKVGSTTYYLPLYSAQS